MRKLIVYNQITLDGYFSGSNGDISWAHSNDPEWITYVEENAKSGGVLVFGRITYELMMKYWPTPLAMQNDPIIADRMNKLPKIVFSRTMSEATWNNTKLVGGDIGKEILKMKKESGKNLVIFGSGTIITQLAQERLIDEYQLVVYPIILGNGRKMIDGVDIRINLKLISSKSFGNGNVLLCYEPEY